MELEFYRWNVIVLPYERRPDPVDNEYKDILWHIASIYLNMMTYYN